jgi:elongation factor P
MKTAGEVRVGDVLRLEGELYRVLEVTRHSGVAQMAGAIFLKLRNIRTQSITERRFKQEAMVEEVYLQRKPLEYLYSQAEDHYFMDMETYEQFPITDELLGGLKDFLQPEMKVEVEFYEGNPVGVVQPEYVVMTVTSTGEARRGEADNVWKTAIIENGMEIMVPPFIKTGDKVKIDVTTRKYLGRLS